MKLEAVIFGAAHGICFTYSQKILLKWLYTYVAIENPERHMREVLHCGSKQQ